MCFIDQLRSNDNQLRLSTYPILFQVHCPFWYNAYKPPNHYIQAGLNLDVVLLGAAWPSLNTVCILKLQVEP